MTDRLGSILFVAAISFLAFVAGAMAILSESFPSEFLRGAYRAGDALLAQRAETRDRFGTDQWRVARSQRKGVTVNNEKEAFGGYTLYTGAGEAAAYLIGMDGRVVQEWRRPFSSIWDEQSVVKEPQPDELIFFDKARMMPNGDLLAIYATAGDTPWGYGMVKLDRDSNVIWRYSAYAHHDFDIAPDGRILALTNDFTSDDIEELGKVDKPFLEDFVVVLSPDGKEIKKISLTRALAKSRFNALKLAIPQYAMGDPLHANAVEYIDPEKARNFPFAKEGDVLVSFRDMSAIAVLSVDTGELVWAARGPWLWQHDASLLPNGRIMLFDNLGGFRKQNGSRVLEIDPKTSAVTWSYSGTDEAPLHSPLRSSAQPLPNGNVLVTESDAGRLFEVNRRGDIVWEFFNPTRGGDGGRLVAVTAWGQRIDLSTLEPDLRSYLEDRDKRPR